MHGALQALKLTLQDGRNQGQILKTVNWLLNKMIKFSGTFGETGKEFRKLNKYIYTYIHTYIHIYKGSGGTGPESQHLEGRGR